MVKPVHGVSAVGSSYAANELQGDADNGRGPVNLVKHSAAYHTTKGKILTATDIGQYKTSDPQKYAKLKKVLDNTTYEVLENGSVRFSLKGDVSVTDFREAYGIKPGSMQTYLRDRHAKEVEAGTVYVTDARIYVDGETRRPSDYDDSSIYHGGGIVNGAENKMLLDYVYNGDKGSYLKYNDGYVDKQVGLFWGGHGPQAQYDGMSLRPQERITIAGSNFR